MVELAAVILILAFLIALLLPALNGALKTAKNAAVGAEINQLAQALASFKTRYGDYPPSRIYLSEDGNLQPNVTNLYGPVNGNAGDITYAQLGQRSIAAMRKFFPRVTFNLGTPTSYWYDFNGDGQAVTNGVTQQYILQGHECLVFFLGGVPLLTTSGYGMTGFGKDPTNPFTNSITGNLGYSANRQAPFFEFVANRLVLDPSDASGIPGYLDSLGNPAPPAIAIPPPPFGIVPGSPVNFYAYFSSYGNGGYDPNDVNFSSELDINLSEAALSYHVAFPVLGANGCFSPAPNPYTSTTTAPFNTTTTPPTPLPLSFLNPQSFQIISSGIDGQYGVGGQYTPDATGESLPLDPNSNFPAGIYLPYINTTDATIRIRERDNVTNFHNGKLE
jgi:general secretion pathway protein G